MAKVSLKNIRKCYPGGIEAVKDVSLEIKDKEFLVLVGPSGCGKSTTLRMIAGLEGLSSGEIFIGDALVNDTPPKDRGIAMVFQDYALYPHMTVYKNMAFGLKLRKCPKSEIELRVRQASDILGITGLLERKPKALSGGQRQRVALGRAIVRQPKVFLFDEPLSNLDAKLRLQMRAEIQKLHQRLQTTMIYVTHDQVEAMTMGDRIVVMLDGRIQQAAPPLELYHHPENKFVASFIGSPPMNLVKGALVRKNGAVRFCDPSKTLDLIVPEEKRVLLEKYFDKEISLGIRPEDLKVNPTHAPVAGRGFTAMVEVVEPTGANINVHVVLGGQTLIAITKSKQAPALNQQCALDVNMENAHFFDDATERAIR